MKNFTDNIFNYKSKHILLIATRVIQVLITAAIIVFITPTKSLFKYEFQAGHYWKHETLTAPFDFAIQKSDEEIAEQKNEIIASKKYYFDYSYSADRKMNEDFSRSFLSFEDDKDWSDEYAGEFYHCVSGILDNIIQHGIISEYVSDKQKNDNIVVINNNVASEHESDEFYSSKEIEKKVEEYVYANFKTIGDRYSDDVINILTKIIIPNIVYNSEKTEEILNSQLEDISLIKGLVSKNQKIISKGEVITADKYQILSSLKKEYEGESNSTGISARIMSLLGQYFLIIIALGAMVLFVYNTNKDIFLDNKKIILIFFIILMMVGMTVGILHINQKYLYVVPLCLTPILVRTFFDTKVSLYVFLVSIIIIGFSVPNSFEFVFYQLIAGMMAILSVERLEKRSEFFKTSLLVFLTYSAIYLSMTLIQDSNLKQIDFYRFLYFAINAAMVLFAFPIVFVLEKIFSMVSEMSLMEYSNTDSKLLRELSIKAPGTFQHCIQVSNIAEDLIHEIGGNALLVRAGSLYHDVGKLLSPMYFIENQNTGLNPLSELTNEESAHIIISHVIDGVKLAHRYNIPEPIVDFIRSHHGTSKTKYFYNKECNEHPEATIDETLYTYPGPKPFSRETAVVMMVDSVEAASRSLKEHSEKSISDLVDNIIDGQIKDNQFSNSDITFADVDKIKKILKKKLQSIYHVRIEYPINKTSSKND